MRLLCVEHKTVWGGGQVALLNVLGEWQRARLPIQAQLVCPPGAEILSRARVLGFDVVPLDLGAIDKTRGSGWNAAHRIRPTTQLFELMRHSQSEAVLANGAFSFLASVAAAKLARVPVVWLEHNITLPNNNILRRMIHWANYMVVVCEPIRAQFVRLVPDAANKVKVIHNGVDPKNFSDDPFARDKVRRTLHWEEHTPVVGTVSRLSREKGLDYFVQAAARIVAEIPDVKFLVVGEGVGRVSLQARANELGLDKSIQFVGFQENVSLYLQAMDIVLFTSLTEAFPLAVLEAMAAARPVVATDVGGVSEQIVEGETGMLVRALDVEGMTRAVSDLLVHEAKRRAFGERGRARVIERFTLTQQAADVYNILERTG